MPGGGCEVCQVLLASSVLFTVGCARVDDAESTIWSSLEFLGRHLARPDSGLDSFICAEFAQQRIEAKPFACECRAAVERDFPRLKLF